MTGPSSEAQRALRFAVRDLRQPLADATLLVSARAKGPEACACGDATLVDELERALNALTERVQDLERIVAREPLPVSAFDARQTSIEVADHARPLLEAAGIEISLTVDEAPSWVRGSRIVFERLLFNLLENVIRYARGAKQVSVEVRARPDHLHLSVVDDGVSDGTRGPRRSSGPGMDFCRWAVQALHGTLSTGDGQAGGQFAVALPLDPAPRSAE